MDAYVEQLLRRNRALTAQILEQPIPESEQTAAAAARTAQAVPAARELEQALRAMDAAAAQAQRLRVPQQQTLPEEALRAVQAALTAGQSAVRPLPASAAAGSAALQMQEILRYDTANRAVSMEEISRFFERDARRYG